MQNKKKKKKRLIIALDVIATANHFPYQDLNKLQK